MVRAAITAEMHRSIKMQTGMWLLALLFIVSDVAAFPAVDNRDGVPQIVVTFPAQHSWWQVSPTTNRLHGVPLHIAIGGFRIPDDGFLRINGDSIGGDDGVVVDHNASEVSMGDLETGSYFFTLQLEWGRPDQRADESRIAAETTLHMEVVSPNVRSALFRHVGRHDGAAPPLRRVSLLPAVNMSTRSQRAPIPICYITTSHGQFDGQKKMWLQVIEALNGPDVTSKFRFAARSFDAITNNSTIVQAFALLDVMLTGQPLQIEQDELDGHNVSPDQVEETLLASFYAEFPELKSSNGTNHRLRPDDIPRLHNLKPDFVSRIWLEHVVPLQSACQDGVAVFANSRSITDEILVHAAHLAGARTVVFELANLYPMPLAVDVLFAPSRFALHHPSVVSNIRARKAFVASTGVNTAVFVPRPSHVPKSEPNEFVVGYVGRLATDKAVGVLVATARLLRRACAFCKVRLIGGGAIKSHLLALADEWELGDALELVDGIYNDEAALVAQLQQMDVYASPCHCETLGIALLEAMSTGLPVVGWITSGPGDFLVNRYNSIGVEERSPEAFRDAILTLVNDAELRVQLGQHARQTVKLRYSRDDRIRDIASLYESFGRAT